jgi:hypothetical protein
MLKLSKEELVAQQLAQDRPTIDAAVKSFLSLVTTRSLNATVHRVASSHDASSSKGGSSSHHALACARTLLHSINSYTFPDAANHPTDSHAQTGLGEQKRDAVVVERDTVAQVWNGLLESQQKPSRFLGRLALMHGWNAILVDMVHPAESYDESVLFSEEFGRLLRTFSSDVIPTEDSDAHLLWDSNPEQELERRRARRRKRAESVKEQERTATTVLAEDEKEGEDDKDEDLKMAAVFTTPDPE